MPGTSPSVLIIRLDAIGDALALTPLLAALQRRDAAVDLVLRPANAGVFSSSAARHVVVADFELRSGTRATRDAISTLGARLAARRYGHVLVASEDPGAYRLAAATRAPERTGFANGWGKPLKTLWTRRFLTRQLYRPAGLDPNGAHECSVLFRLGEGLVDEPEPTRALERLRPLVIDAPVPADPRIAVQITDKWERLGLTRERVVELLREANALGPLRLVGARSEAAYAREIARETGAGVELFERLEPWKAAIASARALIAPDSGALHVAGMVGTPVVAVFPPSPAFSLQTARWAPWAAPYRIVEGSGDWPARAAAALRELLPETAP